MGSADFLFGDGSGGSGSGFGNFTSTNDTLTCVASSIMGQAYPYAFGLSVAARFGLILYHIFLYFVSIPLNALMVYLICKYKSLQTMSFVLILQVVIIDLVGALVLIPLTVISVGANKWLLGENMCIITGVVNYAIGFTRTEIMLCFVIDRFLQVHFAFSYPKYRLKTVCSLSVISLVAPIVLAAVPGFFGCYSFAPSIGQCHLSFNCGLICSVYRGIVSFLVILPSCVVPLFLYAGLFHKAKKINSRTAPASVAIPSLDPDNNKREMRATLTFFLMFVALFAVTAPHAITYIIGTTIYYSSTPPLAFQIVEAIFANVVSLILILDPIVLMRNTDVKDEIVKIKWLPVLWC